MLIAITEIILRKGKLMNQEKLLWTLSEKLRGKLSSNNYMIEIGLLLAWKSLCESNANLSSLEDVINGKATLKMVYEDLEGFQEIGQSYSQSKLPGLLAQNDVEDILKALLAFDEVLVPLLMDRMYSLGAKSSSELGLPDELANIITALGQVDGKTVYTPFGGSIALAVKAKDIAKSVSFEAIEMEPIIAISSVLSDLSITHSDPLTSPSFNNGRELTQFDCVLMSPPLGLKVTNKFLDSFDRFSKGANSDVMRMQHALSQTKSRLVSLATQGLLFRSTGSDYEWRVAMVNRGWIDAIIQLPTSILFNTSMPTVIIVIDKSRDAESPILFFDAEQDDLYEQGGRGQRNKLTQWQEIVDVVLDKKSSSHANLISKEELIGNDYDLSVRRYVLGTGSSLVKQLSDTSPLEKIADLVRAQLLKEDKETSGGETYFEVGARDIGENGTVNQPSKSMVLSGRMRDRAELQRIQPGDIILSTKGTIGKVGLVDESCGNNWVANQTFQVIRLKSTEQIIDPAYLYMYLTSQVIQTYMAEQASGAGIQVLKTGDVKSLPIQILPHKQQKEVIDTRIEILSDYEKISVLKGQIAESHSNFWSC